VAVTENNKPEWFEIVDSDGPAKPPKASKALPVLPMRRLPTDGSDGNDYKREDN